MDSKQRKAVNYFSRYVVDGQENSKKVVDELTYGDIAVVCNEFDQKDEWDKRVVKEVTGL